MVYKSPMKINRDNSNPVSGKVTVEMSENEFRRIVEMLKGCKPASCCAATALDGDAYTVKLSSADVDSLQDFVALSA